MFLSIRTKEVVSKLGVSASLKLWVEFVSNLTTNIPLNQTVSIAEYFPEEARKTPEFEKLALLCLQEILLPWSLSGDKDWVGVDGNTQRVLFKTSNTFSLFEMLDDRPSLNTSIDSRTFKLKKIEEKQVPSLTDLGAYAYSASRSVSRLNQVLEEFLNAPNGAFLCNRTHKSISGCDYLMALRPEVLCVDLDDLVNVQEDILALAQNSPVVFTNRINDAVELLVHCLGVFSGDTNTKDEIATLLRAIFIHERVKKVCSHCAKPTPLDPIWRERLPEVFISKMGATHLFGRGCQLCNESSYRGSVGIYSGVLIPSGVRSQIARVIDVDKLTQETRSNGLRSLLEDGLDRISDGVTSYEAVFAVSGRPSDVYLSSIQRNADRQVAEFSSSEVKRIPGEKISGEATILIVEDDPDQRKVLEMILRTQGYRVISAKDGGEALDICTNNHLDLVVCDLMMPGINGQDLLRRLRGAPETCSIPVLMFTAAGSPEIESDLFEMGADDYCEKGVKKKVLIKRIERLLDSRRHETKAKLNPLSHMLKG